MAHVHEGAGSPQRYSALDPEGLSEPQSMLNGGSPSDPEVRSVYSTRFLRTRISSATLSTPPAPGPTRGLTLERTSHLTHLLGGPPASLDLLRPVTPNSNR